MPFLIARKIAQSTASALRDILFIAAGTIFKGLGRLDASGRFTRSERAARREHNHFSALPGLWGELAVVGFGTYRWGAGRSGCCLREGALDRL